jgi:hypothetical protein
MKLNNGSTTLSAKRPRRHAAIIPSNVPAKNEMIVAVPANRSVHPSPIPITSVTGAGNAVIEVPRLPWADSVDR